MSKFYVRHEWIEYHTSLGALRAHCWAVSRIMTQKNSVRNLCFLIIKNVVSAFWLNLLKSGHCLIKVACVASAAAKNVHLHIYWMFSCGMPAWISGVNDRAEPSEECFRLSRRQAKWSQVKTAEQNARSFTPLAATREPSETWTFRLPAIGDHFTYEPNHSFLAHNEISLRTATHYASAENEWNRTAEKLSNERQTKTQKHFFSLSFISGYCSAFCVMAISNDARAVSTTGQILVSRRARQIFSIDFCLLLRIARRRGKRLIENVIGKKTIRTRNDKSENG